MYTTMPSLRTAAFTDTDLARLQALLDALPAPLEPLDVVMLDGYLCGVLLQPAPVAERDWWPLVLDVDGRPAPPGVDTSALAALARQRHAELERAITGRQWFDPWVYELDDDASPSDTVMPWVAGFATAMEHFPRALAAADTPTLMEPLALLYQYLTPDDLEDADELLAEIETLEPPATLAEAVEDLVRAVLLFADVTRPRRTGPSREGPGPARRSRNRRRA
jgi:uncharacterized protein